VGLHPPLVRYNTLNVQEISVINIIKCMGQENMEISYYGSGKTIYNKEEYKFDLYMNKASGDVVIYINYPKMHSSFLQFDSDNFDESSSELVKNNYILQNFVFQH